MPSFITKKLADRESAGNLRKLPDSKYLIDFVSNDYLGLSRSRELFDRINNRSYEGITQLNGSTGSRLLAGNCDQALALEDRLADIFQAESALLFNSGYVANLAILSSVPQKGDTIIYDQLSHVCLKEGAWLSKARTFSFRHNDCEDLESKLRHAEGQKYVVIESVYSMDGDMAPFEEIIALSKKYDARLIVDEAHGTGLYGTNGSGLVCEKDLHQDFFARVYTFGKAMGVHGACIAGSQELINYLINFAHSFIYTTALPIHSIFAIDEAFSFLADHIELQKESKERIGLFNQKLDLINVRKLPSNSPIQPILIPGNSHVKRIAEALQNDGFDVRPILSPTVKEGSERLRVSIHTHNTPEQIHDLADRLSSHLQ